MDMKLFTSVFLRANQNKTKDGERTNEMGNNKGKQRVLSPSLSTSRLVLFGPGERSADEEER